MPLKSTAQTKALNLFQLMTQDKEALTAAVSAAMVPIATPVLIEVPVIAAPAAVPAIAAAAAVPDIVAAAAVPVATGAVIAAAAAAPAPT